MALLETWQAKHPKWPGAQVHYLPDASHYFVKGLSEMGQLAADFLQGGQFRELDLQSGEEGA